MAVIDASIAAKWVLFEDGHPAADRLLDRLWAGGEALVAPSLLVLEVTNAVYKRVKKGAVSPEDAADVVRALRGLDLRYTDTRELQPLALALAHRHALPAIYDAQYLALASDRGMTLWTADRRLFNAVSADLAWVRWFEEV